VAEVIVSKGADADLERLVIFLREAGYLERGAAE
jgi:hypothetical protein